MPSKIINADVVCEKCGRHVAIKYESTLRKNITKNGVYVCTSCDKKSDQRRARMSLALKEKWNDQAYRRKMSSIERDNEKISEALKEKWRNDEYRCKNVASHQDSSYKNKMSLIGSKNARKAWDDADYRDRVSSSLRRYWESAENRRNASIRSHNVWKREDYKQKILSALERNKTSSSLTTRTLWRRDGYRSRVLAGLKRMWNQERRQIASIRTSKQNLARNQEVRDRIKKSLNLPSCRIKISSASLKFWNDAEYRKKITDLNRKRWQNDDYRCKMALARNRQPRSSSIQKILYSLLNDLGVRHFTDAQKECVIGYYEWDCLIPQQNKLMKPLLIDVNGDYWHSDPRTVVKDKAKWTYTDRYYPQYDKKIIWEHEFYTAERVPTLLRHWLGMPVNVVDFSFNQVSIRETTTDEANLLMSKYHYSGKLGRGGIKYGAYIGDALIAVCVYSCPTRQESAKLQNCNFDEILELSRFCIHPAYQKKNFATWFIARTTKALKSIEIIKKVISFADTTYNHVGTIYKAGNWRLDGIVAPDYWYVDRDGFKMHKKTLWNHASRMSMKESEFCRRYGYLKIMGKEKFRYVFEL